MTLARKLTISIGLFALSIPAIASSVYVVNAPPVGPGQFGTIDLTTGVYTQVGNTPLGSSNLIPTGNGSLLSLDAAGNLVSINPATGGTTQVGPTGLADCSAPPASPCGPHAASALGALNGTLYATDLANNLYRVNATTGTATLIGPTGIPALPFTPATFNANGTLNIYDETLFASNGSLYATFDAGVINFGPPFTATPVISPDLYRIDPVTGSASLIGSTQFGIGAIADISGTFYGFDNARNEILTIDLATGATSDFGDFDPAAGVVTGVIATPEPASLALIAVALSGLGLWRRTLRANARPIAGLLFF